MISINRRQMGVLSGLLYIKGIGIEVVGFDERDDPVLIVTDAKGRSAPWAVRRTDIAQGLYTEPLGDVRAMTPEESDDYDHDALQLLDRAFNRRQ